MTAEPLPPEDSRPRLRALARLVAVVAAALAVADLVRWGNRWYVSTMFADTSPGMELDRLLAAHSALVAGLVWLAVATATAAFGWHLRVVTR